MRGYLKGLIREVLDDIKLEEMHALPINKAIEEPPAEPVIRHTAEQYKSVAYSKGVYAILYCERAVTNSPKNKPTIQKFLLGYTPGFNEVYELLGKPLFPIWAETSIKNPFFFTEMGEITELFIAKKYKTAEEAVADNFADVL